MLVTCDILFKITATFSHVNKGIPLPSENSTEWKSALGAMNLISGKLKQDFHQKSKKIDHKSLDTSVFFLKVWQQRHVLAIPRFEFCFDGGLFQWTRAGGPSVASWVKECSRPIAGNVYTIGLTRGLGVIMAPPFSI